jgi:hypothetical protein
MRERHTKMDKDKFQYFLEFVSMRLDDPTFRDQYGAGEFENWYSDFMEVLNQKHGEYYNES